MSRDVDLLIPTFHADLDRLVAACAADGVKMVPYYTERTPEEQAILWRQSRPTSTVNASIAMMRDAGAPYLAGVLEGVGPRNGPHVTGARPGESWHQYGEAVDCYWDVGGRAEWSPDVGGDANGYRTYARHAVALGLTAGGLWSSFQDWPHVQARSTSNPIRLIGWPEADRIMRERYQSRSE